MEESREGPPKGKSFFQKGWEFLKKSLEAGVDKIPAEEIDEHTAAWTIINYLGNPLRERLGEDRWANPFSITTVMKNMGHVAALRGTDYQERFPKEYRATRKALWKLVREGALEIQEAEASDDEQERILYQVVNEKKLREIAKKR